MKTNQSSRQCTLLLKIENWLPLEKYCIRHYHLHVDTQHVEERKSVQDHQSFWLILLGVLTVALSGLLLFLILMVALLKFVEWRVRRKKD